MRLKDVQGIDDARKDPLNAPPANAMSVHDWPEFEKHPNPCRTDNGNGEIYAIRLSREAYNYAKVRIDACAGATFALLPAPPSNAILSGGTSATNALLDQGD